MADRPLYPKVVAGYVDNDRGEDARVLGERVAARDGGELKLVTVEKGSPEDALQGLAERGEADLIVLGSTHHASFGSVAPGSVAEHLLHGARCRLLIAPKGYAESDHSGDRLRVLAVGYDGMAESQAALDEAAVLAGKFGASMKVVGVVTPIPPAAAAAAAQAGRRPAPTSRVACTTQSRGSPRSCARCRCSRRAIRSRSCSRLPKWGWIFWSLVLGDSGP